MAAVKIIDVVSRPDASLGITATDGKKCGFLEVTKALKAKLEAAGKPVRDLPAEGTVLVGVELGAEFSFNFGMQGNGGAIVPSIRGINPLTGIRAGIDPWTSGRGDFCPADPGHGRLGHNGKCTVCDHTWAAANYLVAAPGADLPGWRTGEGEFRKFVATTDMLKDVATAIDSSSVVPALGFAFYKSTKQAQSWSPFYVYNWYAPWRRYPWGGVWLDWGSPYIYSTCLTSSLVCDTSTVNTAYYSSSSKPFGSSRSAKSASYTSSVTADNCCVGPIGISGNEGVSGEPGLVGAQADMPAPLAVGASKTVTEVKEQKTPTLLPQDLFEEPAQVIDAVLVSWEFLTGLVDSANSVITSGPMKGIPLS